MSMRGFGFLALLWALALPLGLASYANANPGKGSQAKAGPAAPAAPAAPEERFKALEERFIAMDTDKDGKVSPQEFAIALPQMRDTAFAAMDEDASGFLSLEEWQKAMAGHAGGMQMPPRMPLSGSGEQAGFSSSNATIKAPELIMPPAKTP